MFECELVRSQTEIPANFLVLLFPRSNSPVSFSKRFLMVPRQKETCAKARCLVFGPVSFCPSKIIFSREYMCRCGCSETLTGCGHTHTHTRARARAHTHTHTHTHTHRREINFKCQFLMNDSRQRETEKEHKTLDQVR